MANLVNPKLEVRIFGTTDFTLDPVYTYIEIDKDIDEEPDDCEITLYNLGPDQLSRLEDSEDMDAPIEVWCTRSGGEDLIIAFRGEIDGVETQFTRPGHTTTINCVAAKYNQEHTFFDKTFSANTPKNSIVDELVTTLGVPTGNIGDLPTDGLLLSQTYSGNAFEQLRKVTYDMGLRPFITDGTLHLSSIYKPVDFEVFVIEAANLLGTPRRKTRIDGVLTEQMVTAELGADEFGQVRPRRKKNKKAMGFTTYTEYEVVDKAIPGISFTALMQPDLNPDKIIRVAGFDDKYYRVTSVNHYGNTEMFDEWSTDVEADLYEDMDGDISE